ncbi:molybdenum cofactor guanylyltransferase [Hansschlegelia quercus]|uniref:Molybdenum cofactor guanylyltransferase n=1 Tax=Hansschlegelia quercus TaxID=2528245 RepID=A0A4Q9GKC6_9HYPH|nr:NTP transferase domain-containing protein [Hansschlegelia quercus]TBN54809.1 molybdenum cofactor guanylyltransferase [Hansschlegelia quercus]
MIQTIAGLILMGGSSSRMGGGDKALLPFAGATILDAAIARFEPQVSALAISANGDPARLARFRLPVLPDPADEPKGPLGGVRAGLAWATSLKGVTHLATVPADAPSPPLDLVAQLAKAAGDSAAVAIGPDGIEPLHALWPIACAEALDALIAGGVSSPKRALERIEAAPAFFDARDAFLDVDTPDDLAAAKKLLGG